MIHRLRGAIGFAVAVCLFPGCRDEGVSVPQDTGLAGQVLLISHAGPIPAGWVPPHLEQVSTILVLDGQRHVLFDKKTSDKGEFTILLSPGTYYLRVEESPLAAESGPFVVQSGFLVSAEAYFDNGMR